MPRLLGGGYHHAKPDAGEGFCIYNDLAIAIRSLQKDALIRRACVIDLDVHQGNGTAVIFAGDDNVFTFSMHQRNIYPIPKQTSDWDIELDSGTTDQEYIKVLQDALPAAVEIAVTPVGQIVGRMNQLRTARQVVFEMIDEYLDTVERMARLMEGRAKGA